MKKRVFIIHGWDYTPKMNWYPWIEKELEKKGFLVQVPEMPNTSEPRINEWVAHLKKKVGKLDKNTFFIGHSIGCQTIMRYLQNEKTSAGGAVFVAGWFNLDNLESEEVENIAWPWIEDKIDFKKLKNNLKNLIVILSTNDPYNCLEENSKIFQKKLGAKLIIEKNKGHFTSDDNVLEIHAALNELLEIAK